LVVELTGDHWEGDSLEWRDCDVHS
jgi:hypothetical protein